MTNHMAEVAQMLGVKLEEVFKVTDDDSGKYHNYYRFTEKKGIEVSEDNVKWEADTAEVLVLKWLLIGVARIIKLPWKPKYDEKYYIPSISNAFGYNSFYWKGDDSDEKYYNFGIICKSKEEAIALRQKMLAVAKKNNE